MPELSIIVPVYNVEKYLNKCIESILNQTFKDFELILVDDGSTDLSLQICKNFAEKDKRIKVLSQENKGPSSARNNALKIAKGHFIGFVDSDDYIEAETYQKALKQMDKDIDIVIWGVNVFSEDNLPYVDWFDNYFNNNKIGKKKLNLNLLFDIAVVPWNKLYRHSIIKNHKIDFPDGRLYEDNAFWWKYTMWCKKVFFIPEKLHYYNMRINSLRGEVNLQNQEMEKDRIYMVENVYDYCKKNNLTNKNQLLLEKLLSHSFSEAYNQSSQKEAIIQQAYELVKKMQLEYSKDEEIQNIINLTKTDDNIQNTVNYYFDKIKKLPENQKTLDYIYNVINKLYSNEKADEIIILTEKLREINFNNYEFDRILGDVYYFLKNEPEKALVNYLKYTKVIKNNASVYNVLSEIFGSFGDVFNEVKYKQKALNV